MISGALEAGVAILIALVGGIYIIGQIKENAKRNQEDIKTIREMIGQYQEDTKDLIEKMITDMKVLIDENKFHQADSLSRETSHLKDLISINNSEIRADIQRLESRQDQANHLRERFAIMAASLKSLHKRLDLEPPVLLNSEDEDR